MTPAIRLLDAQQVRYRLHEYAHDPRAASYGLEAVEKLDLDPERVFKTLVASVDGRLVCCVIPVERQLDLRALGKRAAMATPQEAERATGYVVGGISPLGQRRRLETIVDESALAHETVHVSAGRRGLEVELDPRDLVRLTAARVTRCASA
ncbi:MAG TPA: Cys-tRNA(Pro) deacylase [Gaiellaceae bacterium]|nr:Cys-tRNA(Pro) deacylase [Gaiellaceae bacterium]